MSEFYGRDGAPISFSEWAHSFAEDRHIGDTYITPSVYHPLSWFAGTVRVSTVWLGLDHSFGGPVPLIFETLVFGGRHDGFMLRYPTEDQARAMHDQIVAAVRRGRRPSLEVMS
jgi:hypothetical protein